MGKPVANPTRRPAGRKTRRTPDGPITPEVVAEALPRILGPRARGLALDPIVFAALATTAEPARQAYAQHREAGRRRAALTKAVAALAEIPEAAPQRADLAAMRAAMLAAPRTKWAGQDHAALVLAREFQTVIRFLVPAADLGNGGATARFVAWAMTRITGAVTSELSAERMVKRHAKATKAGREQARKSLQDQGF